MDGLLDLLDDNWLEVALPDTWINQRYDKIDKQLVKRKIET